MKANDRQEMQDGVQAWYDSHLEHNKEIVEERRYQLRGDARTIVESSVVWRAPNWFTRYELFDGQLSRKAFFVCEAVGGGDAIVWKGRMHFGAISMDAKAIYAQREEPARKPRRKPKAAAKRAKKVQS